MIASRARVQLVDLRMAASLRTTRLLFSRSLVRAPVRGMAAFAIPAVQRMDKLRETRPNVLSVPRRGHCQVPCGIFDDPKLVSEIEEGCATIRKAMVQINELSVCCSRIRVNFQLHGLHAAHACVRPPESSPISGWQATPSPLNFNQMTRWVNTKEEHASKIIDVSLQHMRARIHRLAC